jgi:hypothetical protein
LKIFIDEFSVSNVVQVNYRHSSFLRKEKALVVLKKYCEKLSMLPFHMKVSLEANEYTIPDTEFDNQIQ